MATLQSFKKLGAGLVFFMALSISGQAAAQLTSSIDTAIETANRWAVLADANQADRMWTGSGPVMQKNVTKEDWLKYLASLQTELGRVSSREWVQVVRITNPTNLPPGEYINVVFSSQFSKAPAVEKISLTRAADKWIPVGYVVSKVETSPAPAAAAPAAAPAAK